jgi:nicotinamidase/pyrazinamidase
MVRIDPRTDALLAVDLQPDFMPGGPLAVEEGDRIVVPTAELMHRFETVVATQDWHPPGHISFATTHGKKPLDVIYLPAGHQRLWPDHAVQGTAGARMHPDVPDHRVTLILRKGTRTGVDSYSAFRENPDDAGHRLSTGLAAWLKARGIERVFIAGLARDYCVLWSAEDASATGFETYVLDDLTRAVMPERAAETDARLEAAHVHRITSRDLQ